MSIFDLFLIFINFCLIYLFGRCNLQTIIIVINYEIKDNYLNNLILHNNIEIYKYNKTYTSFYKKTIIVNYVLYIFIIFSKIKSQLRKLIDGS
jgi:hypothetical protein